MGKKKKKKDITNPVLNNLKDTFLFTFAVLNFKQNIFFLARNNYSTLLNRCLHINYFSLRNYISNLETYFQINQPRLNLWRYILALKQYLSTFKQTFFSPHNYSWKWSQLYQTRRMTAPSSNLQSNVSICAVLYVSIDTTTFFCYVFIDTTTFFCY